MAKKFDEDKINKVLELISGSHSGIHKSCKQVGISVNTMYAWIDASTGNENRYARAREAQADLLVEETLQISDDSSRDTFVTDKGIEAEDREWTNRSKLRVDTRKWLAAKLRPKKYGDKIEVDAKIDATVTVITGMEIK